jgi:hypothetical protein
MRRREEVLDLYNSILGAILFASPWVFAFPLGTMRLDAWICGALLVVLSASAFFAFAEWEEWMNLLIGCWILVSPWILGFQHTTAMHVTAILGAAVVYLSALELWYIHFSFETSEPARRN